MRIPNTWTWNRSRTRATREDGAIIERVCKHGTSDRWKAYHPDLGWLHTSAGNLRTARDAAGAVRLLGKAMRERRRAIALNGPNVHGGSLVMMHGKLYFVTERSGHGTYKAYPIQLLSPVYLESREIDEAMKEEHVSAE